MYFQSEFHFLVNLFVFLGKNAEDLFEQSEFRKHPKRIDKLALRKMSEHIKICFTAVSIAYL